MSTLIPPFDWQSVLLAPWSTDFESSRWIFLMGFFVTAACGLVGNFLLLRRLALIGDAISHSILPGLALAFVAFKTTSIWASFTGAVVAALATVAVIEFIHRHSRVKPDAAICIAFTTFFALGVALVSMLETTGSIHIDAECVLYGEISFVPLEEPFRCFGHDLGPVSVIRMGFMLVLVIGAIVLFYKELLLTSFDAGLARSLGFRTSLWHYGLMGMLALVVVCSFEAVGAILAVAMLIVPPMFAAQLSQHLPTRLTLTVLHAALCSLVGLHLSLWLRCSTAAAMVVASAGMFVMVWLASLARPILRKL